MVEARSKQILVDGKPAVVLCGELHYFRLPRSTWKERIRQLASSGCNTVASYVPWLCHEPTDGAVDLAGTTRPELDLGAFIDLCAEAGLWFFLRPGPFIMAEMKNEGIPYWVYRKHPEIVPVTWDGKPVTTRTVDYLAPSFLQEARRWYAAVDAVVAPRIQPNGGPVIAVQADNEIGMLSWVSNSPDLTDGVLTGFSIWLLERYGPAQARARYPFLGEEAAAQRAGFRCPREDCAGRLMRDLGHYMRARFARYAATLRAWAEEDGVRGVPFVINVHGTSGGRGFTFPIGVSQLYPSWSRLPGWMAGTDIYLGNLTMDNFQDLHVINAFTEAVNGADQPLASVELECGDGNYGQTLGGRFDPSAADFKTRMCVAQGARLLNYYLMAGGVNFRLAPPPGDGNDRIAFTGERHGFAAPISPEGALNYTWPRMVRAIRTVDAVAAALSGMTEEHDGLSLGFIPDYWMTESRYPGSRLMAEICSGLETGRGFGAWEVMVRALLLAGYRFGARNIQDQPLEPSAAPALALGSARFMDAALQEKLAAWIHAGGRLLLYGEVPTRDMEGSPCDILARSIGAVPRRLVTGSDRPYLSVCFGGWAAPRAEVGTAWAQAFEKAPGDVILTVYGTGQACGFETAAGSGRVIVTAAGIPCDIAFFRTAMERLGVTAGLQHDCAAYGIWMTSTASPDGARLIHVINLDGFEKELRLSLDRKRLFGGRRLRLAQREAVMLPLGVTFPGVKILESTAEIARVSRGALGFRLTQAEDIITLETDRKITPSKDYRIERKGRAARIVSRKDARVDDALVVRLA